MELITKMLGGDAVALSQLITKIENDLIDISKVMNEIHGYPGHSYRIGITGPPGAGKSTLVDKLTTTIRGKGFSIGIIMVDPSSPFSGGAFLGDCVRLQMHYLDQSVFIRSMASRGKIGGLSKKVWPVVKLLDSYGKDFILVETVGVGQAETNMPMIADTTILVLVPHAGDIIQAMKAGIIEIGDIIVVNKSDLGGADHLISDLNSILKQRRRQDLWTPPIIQAQTLNNVGVENIYDTVGLHRQFLDREGLFLKRRLKKEAEVFVELMSEELSAQLVKFFKHSERFKIYFSKLESREIDPYTACREILSNPETWQMLQAHFLEMLK